MRLGVGVLDGETGEIAMTDACLTAIGIGAGAGFEFFAEAAGGTGGGPFAFSQVRPAIIAQADDIDLVCGIPVFANFEIRPHTFLGIQRGHGLPAETFETMSKVAVQLWFYNFLHGLCRRAAGDADLTRNV